MNKKSSEPKCAFANTPHNSASNSNPSQQTQQLSKLVPEEVAKHASTPIIVGREDTGALEAQIRGSRYPWEMLLSSVEGLIRLVQVKEKSGDATPVKQIR